MTIRALFPNALDPDNLLLDADSYKHSHAAQYPARTTRVFSYIEARADWDGIADLLFFGLQIELARLAGPVVTQAMIDAAAPFLRAHGLAPNLAGWQRIVTVHGGRLPVRIDALPEGTIVPVGVPQLRIVNTDPALGWLVGFLETRLLRAIWYPTTVASLSRHVVGEIAKRRLITDGTTDGAAFALHDFGARGAACGDAAAIGGCAHLVSSMGTDTLAGLMVARNVYGADMAGFSIPATEHATVTANGGEGGELGFMDRLLDIYPDGPVACVSDSYDLMRAVAEYWGGALRDKVLARDGVLVVRPDSGDAVDIVPMVVEALGAAFGFSTTPTGYRLLHDKVRVLQGDGVDRRSVVRIMEALMARGLAVSNVAFGMGGGLLQKLDRDSFGYAMKCSAIEVDGAWRDVWKDPKTARGTKTSKRGRIGAMIANGRLASARIEDIPAGRDALVPAFEDGEIHRIQTFDDIRARAAAG